jgi:glycosyltransferase involved in cell wall biosynthesis
VSTHSTGCDEIIRDGQTGRLVAVEDPAALACAILDVLNDQTEAQRMANNLHNLVCTQFTWKHAWRKYRTLLEV